MPNDAVVEAAPRWRHTKRGTTYTEIGRGKMQSEYWVSTDKDDPDSVDMAEVVIYRADHDGQFWVRPVSEFEDGRFERIKDAPSPSDLAQVKAALVPVARLVDLVDPLLADDYPTFLSGLKGDVSLTMGDLRRAREALAILERAGA